MEKEITKSPVYYTDVSGCSNVSLDSIKHVGLSLEPWSIEPKKEDE